MDEFSLYSRMREHGTLAETPRDVPDARFALPSTIYWMRALAILAEGLKLDFKAARTFYDKVQRRPLSEPELNSVCEQLLFALHQIAALQAISAVPNKVDVARVGIVAWYYGVYGAASAMIAAADGSFPIPMRPPPSSGIGIFRQTASPCPRSAIGFRIFSTTRSRTSLLWCVRAASTRSR